MKLTRIQTLNRVKQVIAEAKEMDDYRRVFAVQKLGSDLGFSEAARKALAAPLRKKFEDVEAETISATELKRFQDQLDGILFEHVIVPITGEPQFRERVRRYHRRS